MTLKWVAPAVAATVHAATATMPTVRGTWATTTRARMPTPSRHIGSTKNASGQPLKARRLHSTPTSSPAPQASSRRWSGSARRARLARIQAQNPSSSRPPPISIQSDPPYASRTCSQISSGSDWKPSCSV